MARQKDRLEIAIQIAKEAGAFARDRFLTRSALTVEKKGEQDYVSEADRDTETLIRTRLSQSLPYDAFLGEEHGGAGSGPMWVVDPIDGTINFLHGVRYWCVSMAYWDGEDVEIGVIYDPMADECFAASRGNGATFNGAPMRASMCNDLAKAMVCHGYVARHSREGFFKQRNALMDAGVAVKDMGAGALMLAHVAAGRYDAYAEDHMHPWDALAGLCMVREAGGRVLKYPERPDALLDGGRVLASAPALFDPLSALLTRQFDV